MFECEFGSGFVSSYSSILIYFWMRTPKDTFYIQRQESFMFDWNWISSGKNNLYDGKLLSKKSIRLIYLWTTNSLSTVWLVCNVFLFVTVCIRWLAKKLCHVKFRGNPYDGNINQMSNLLLGAIFKKCN